MNNQQIAAICHAANKQICELMGDYSQKSWEEAEEWQRESAIKGVEFKINNPLASPESQHEAWCKDKIEHGWVFGNTKDAEMKTHPCLVPYDKLPIEQRAKDVVFVAIVESLRKLFFNI